MITTLPHAYALLWSPPPAYAAIVALSTGFSLLWHTMDGPAVSWLGILEHEIAVLWFLTDSYYLASSNEEFTQALVINGSVFAASFLVSWLDYANLIPYHIGHSASHLVSALKAFYVAALVSAVSRQVAAP
jgi:riboflavin transporter FmnP